MVKYADSEVCGGIIVDYYLITPVKHLWEEFVIEHPFHLIEAPIVKDHLDEYKKFVKTVQHTIMDTGVYLGKMVTCEEFFELVKEVEPEWVVLPDVEGDFNATMDAADNVYEMLARLSWKVGTIGVPQGKDIFEWVHCYRLMIDLQVDKIGMPVRQALRGCSLKLVETGVQTHWLGLHETKELEGARKVQSIDTSLPWRAAKAGRILSNYLRMDNRMLFEEEFTPGELMLARENIATLRDLCNRAR